MKFLRLYLSLSQLELAGRAGIGQNHLSKIELGKVVARPRTLKKITAVFSRKLHIKVNPDILLETSVHDRVIKILSPVRRKR